MVPEEITSRIGAFLQHYLKESDKRLSEEGFETLKKSVISKLGGKPTGLQIEADVYDLNRFKYY